MENKRSKLGDLDGLENLAESLSDVVEKMPGETTLLNLPPATIFDKELSEEDLRLVRKQWTLFQKLKLLKVANPLKIRVQNDLPELNAGTLIHGASYSRDKIKAIQDEGILSGELHGVLEDNETNYCADFFKVTERQSVNSYLEWAQQPDRTGKLVRPKPERNFLPTKIDSKIQKIAFVVDPGVNELKDLLEMDAYSEGGNQAMKGIITGLPVEINSDKGQRLSAILCGVPANFISGIIVSKALAEDVDELEYIKKTFGPEVVIFDVEGRVI